MSLADNLATVRARIEAATARAGRPPGSVALLAVTKGFGASAVREALAAGQADFGENYLQEALGKMREVADPAIRWHFIGPLQGNKTADVAAAFAWVHSIDRLKIAQRLSAQRPGTLPPLNVCVQVNISAEASKSGVAPADALALCRAVAALPRLKLRGLMAIPAPAKERGQSPFSETTENGDSPRASYRALRALYDALRREGLGLDTLSAGMSDDLEAAIAEGSTLVRIGTAIFGRRD